MAPGEDVERGRASSGADRQKSIVSMTEFEGMDEYTALQKYILFYRDSKKNEHEGGETKKKAWWQFWKSGSPTANVAQRDPGAVDDDRTYYPHHLPSSPSPAAHLHGAASLNAVICSARSPFVDLRGDIGWLASTWPELKLLAASDAMAARAVEPIMQAGSTKLPALLHAR